MLKKDAEMQRRGDTEKEPFRKFFSALPILRVSPSPRLPVFSSPPNPITTTK